MARAGRVSSAWTGWVGFAGIVMIVIGALNFFEGLIAVIRGQYYVHTADQILLVDFTSSASSAVRTTRCGRSPCWR